MRSPNLSAFLRDPHRLEALQAVALLDTPTEASFDRLARLAARLLDAPVALVTLVDADRQFFKSCIGLPEPWHSMRETPLSHSFCQHNRYAGEPLVIEDARVHPLVQSNLAIKDLNVIAYLGIPLVTEDGYILGSFCVIDLQPRRWKQEDIETVEDLAASVMTQIYLRAEIETRRQVEEERDDLSDLAKQLVEEIAARMQSDERRRQLEVKLLRKQKMEAVGRLAGGIAHDFNNLLTPILIYSQSLASGENLHPKQVDALNQIHKAGERARNLVRHLLAFGRKQPMAFEVIDLNETILGIEKLLRRTIPEDIVIHLELGAEHGRLKGDASQIEQIIMNLIVNAADAMPEGGEIWIKTGIECLHESSTGMNLEVNPGPYVLFSVRDTGHGMTADTQERLFEPFFTTKGKDGTGLGLATVLGIVEQHGGNIRFATELNQGTSFDVYLPSTDKAVPQAVPKERGIEPTSAIETILLVEDDDQVRQLTRDVLESNGFTVFTAKSGVQGMEILAGYAGPIDLLLTDVVMPGLNGRELYEKAVQARPDLKVLYMSGYSEEIISHRGILDTGIQFIPKPFLADDLIKVVRGVLVTDGNQPVDGAANLRV